MNAIKTPAIKTALMLMAAIFPSNTEVLLRANSVKATITATDLIIPVFFIGCKD